MRSYEMACKLADRLAENGDIWVIRSSGCNKCFDVTNNSKASGKIYKGVNQNSLS